VDKKIVHETGISWLVGGRQLIAATGALRALEVPAAGRA
jgi:hypothetical protein